MAELVDNARDAGSSTLEIYTGILLFYNLRGYLYYLVVNKALAVNRKLYVFKIYHWYYYMMNYMYVSML